MNIRMYFIFLCLIIVGLYYVNRVSVHKQSSTIIWSFESIDTMKFSRDLARQELHNPAFDKTIDMQMADIAQTGANYVAIGTPYDEEFVPILKRWVASARAHHLHVWFRGNFSGWEGWFGYQKMTPSQHKQLVQSFILANSSLFQDGDIFTACPECENGGPGDPRQTGDVDGFRQFLIEEYHITSNAFAHIGKHVTSNYDSMNADVAQLVMDKATTQALGGVVTIDHYALTGKDTAQKAKDIAKSSGGKVVIGEFGAPIPDIQGDMTEPQQASWVNDTLTQLQKTGVVIGVNYWTSFGGTTAIWSEDGKPKQAVASLRKVYITKTTLH